MPNLDHLRNIRLRNGRDLQFDFPRHVKSDGEQLEQNVCLNVYNVLVLSVQGHFEVIRRTFDFFDFRQPCI